jgi:hypothetical protein
MYSRPTEDADVVSQAIYGANVGILEQKDGWARIRTADDYTGWAQLAALRLSAPYAASGRVAQVESLFAHIYREPNLTLHAPLLTVPFETKLEIAAERDERWLELRLPDRRAGFVQRGDVLFDPKPLDIPAESLQQLLLRVFASFKLFAELSELLAKPLNAAFVKLRQRFRNRKDERQIQIFNPSLRNRVEEPHGVYIVAEKLTADGHFVSGREKVEYSASHRKLSGTLNLITALISRR